MWNYVEGPSEIQNYNGGNGHYYTQGWQTQGTTLLVVILEAF